MKDNGRDDIGCVIKINNDKVFYKVDITMEEHNIHSARITNIVGNGNKNILKNLTGLPLNIFVMYNEKLKNKISQNGNKLSIFVSFKEFIHKDDGYIKLNHDKIFFIN